MGIVLVAALIFLTPMIGSLTGAFAGWVVGLFFADTILGIFRQIGITGVEMWQVGMFLGFVGGFFRASITKQRDTP